MLKLNNIRIFLIKILLRGDEYDMAVVYATLIIRGARTYEQVPPTLKEQVKQVLIDLEMRHLAE